MANVDFPFPGAGELNKRVEIRLRHDVPTGLAGLVEEHSEPLKRWAKLTPVGTAVYAASVQTDERITHRCIVRYVQGVTERHEVVHKDAVYRVRRCADLRGAGQYLVMELEELGKESAL